MTGTSITTAAQPHEPAALRTAIRLLEIGLWPVPIHSPDALVNAPGKQPIGEGWGSNRHTIESLREAWRKSPNAGVGILLGENGGVIDIEIDDPSTGEDSLSALFGGEVVDTMGWTSRRGRHLLFRWDGRLARFDNHVLKEAEGTLPGFPGIELRIGSDKARAKQTQSVCPPSPMTETDKSGRIISIAPRVWNGVAVIATLPGTVFATLDAIIPVGSAKPSSPPVVPPADRASEAQRRYALGALDNEINAVQSEPEGGRNDRLNLAAFNIGQLVGARAVELAVAWAAIENAAILNGLGQKEIISTLRSGFKAGQEKPRDLSKIGVESETGKAFVSSLKPADAPAADLDDIATAADLVLAQAGVEWVWEGWMQRGVLTLLAAEPGVGKTRFGLDLCRRVYLGLPWPDGQPMGLPAGTTTLWVPADNNHSELAEIPPNFGFPPSAIYLNTSKSDLYGGTELTTPEQLGRLEFHIRCVNPGLVFIDTITNTSDYKSHDTSDAKKQYKPLQEIAKRTGVPIICITHLNQAGKTVGRRADEKVRIAIRLEKPDPEGQPNRRKLWVTKSNSVMPKPLGITMGGEGNDYDFEPPVAPDDEQPRAFVGGQGGGRANQHGGANDRLNECMAWLYESVDGDPQRVSDLRTLATGRGFSTKTLYKARDTLKLNELEVEGRKYWEVTPTATF